MPKKKEIALPIIDTPMMGIRHPLCHLLMSKVAVMHKTFMQDTISEFLLVTKPKGTSKCLG
jgi:hypothetical protein